MVKIDQHQELWNVDGKKHSMLPLAIPGGTLLRKRPALDGLFDTLSKKCKLEDLGNYILSDDKLSSYIIEQKQRKD